MNLTKEQKLKIIEKLQELANPKYKNTTLHKHITEAVSQAVYQKGYITFKNNFSEKWYCNAAQQKHIIEIILHLEKTGCIEYVRDRVTKITNKITDYKLNK